MQLLRRAIAVAGMLLALLLRIPDVSQYTPLPSLADLLADMARGKVARRYWHRGFGSS